MSKALELWHESLAKKIRVIGEATHLFAKVAANLTFGKVAPVLASSEVLIEDLRAQYAAGNAAARDLDRLSGQLDDIRDHLALGAALMDEIIFGKSKALMQLPPGLSSFLNKPFFSATFVPVPTAVPTEAPKAAPYDSGPAIPRVSEKGKVLLPMGGWWKTKNRYTEFIRHVKAVTGVKEEVRLRVLLGAIQERLKFELPKLPATWDRGVDRNKIFANELRIALEGPIAQLSVSPECNLSHLLALFEQDWRLAHPTNSPPPLQISVMVTKTKDAKKPKKSLKK